MLRAEVADVGRACTPCIPLGSADRSSSQRPTNSLQSTPAPLGQSRRERRRRLGNREVKHEAEVTSRCACCKNSLDRRARPQKVHQATAWLLHNAILSSPRTKTRCTKELRAPRAAAAVPFSLSWHTCGDAYASIESPPSSEILT